jgi:predicted dehydrogenase
VTVRVGFVGCGALANRMHYPSLAELPEAELVALCDLDPAKLQATGDRYGVAARYRDHREMLATERLDAVYVVMPPTADLVPIVLDCLRAGKHVFMEKPPGAALADCERMLDAAERAGVKTQVGFNRRFADVLVEARRAVGAQGKVAQVVGEFHKNMLRTGPYYGLSILTTDVIHTIDTLRWLAGEPVEVQSMHDRFGADWPNVHAALIRFDSGAVGVLLANRAAGSRYERFELHGPGISAYVRAPERAELFRDGEAEPTVLNGSSDDPRISYGYLAESRHFLDCIQRDRLPQTSLQDAVKTFRLVEQLNRAAERVPTLSS